MPYHSRTHHSGICIPYVQSMHKECTCLYIVRTRMNHVCSTFIHATRNVACLCTDFSKNKKWHRSRFEPMILCILTSCLDHYTTSVLVKIVIVALYIYVYIVFTCRAQLTSVLSGRAQPRPAVEQSAWRRRCGGTQGTVPVAVGPSRPRPGNTDKLTRRVGSTKVP